MEKIRKNYPDIAPSGPTFSRGVRAGNTLYIAGCTARGTEAQGQNIMEQLRVTLDRIVRIVAEEGGVPSDIVKITTFVTSIPDWRADRERQEALFAEYLPGANIRPTPWWKSPRWRRMGWTWRLRRLWSWVSVNNHDVELDWPCLQLPSYPMPAF